jgi:hypothetical protein
MKKFSILITTKNRLPDLIITLNKIYNLKKTIIKKLFSIVYKNT